MEVHADDERFERDKHQVIVFLMKLLAAMTAIVIYDEQQRQQRRLCRDLRGRHGQHTTVAYVKRYQITPSFTTALGIEPIMESMSASQTDKLHDLFQACLPWLNLPYWLSERTYEDDFMLTTLAMAQQAALLRREGNTGGRPRSAGKCMSIFGFTWSFMRARAGRTALEASASSTSHSYRILRHGLWAMIQALSNSNVVSWPT